MREGRIRGEHLFLLLNNIYIFKFINIIVQNKKTKMVAGGGFEPPISGL
ncbi:protein of unknown function [Methanocaldococcus lauensis]|uniref:Uncharacterized protein n=1 Tax=Methanocaldococcus lauensis TaxID=2546128 RepID=A0A8D6PQR9_9EURY|nr:protein of unknown function [Methanocaldococcus lauensis]